MRVRAAQPTNDFVFGVGIYHADGTNVYGTNTDLEGLISDNLELDGRVSFVMPSLDLVADKIAQPADIVGPARSKDIGRRLKIKTVDGGWITVAGISAANLRPGKVVVDLGSRGGLDVFLAAKKVGPTGKAIGIDMTPEMMAKVVMENYDPQFAPRTKAGDCGSAVALPVGSDDEAGHLSLARAPRA